MHRPIICALLLLPALSGCGKTDERLKALEDRIGKLEQTAASRQTVTLKPGAAGYGLLESDMGRIAVTIANIEPYAGGSRVTLDFGNPSAARLSGMKARIEWGGNDAKGLPMAPTQAQSMAFTAPEPLPPGSWKQYVIDLPGVPPTQLGWLRVSAFESGTVDLLSQ
ncbi:DUF3251 domain-containing protein [Rhizorhabdus dicambivorans]|uniref:DUF3251 domain-containing protein n=1 Tax=Rhizorhabdus dicambivorans TaxID=1850238 RepID=A0A2A4FS33_9SPHN|nr:DUF3251 domain-containing protein [Rhizorhabdus dicambivorans]ATE64018.1 DUF3251 domain-containing protein [Rhizorhabdus dicambivorans]PCE40211.1 DUF3251 domain-containing protein [Rhizorhabdus dicambivorans]